MARLVPARESIWRDSCPLENPFHVHNVPVSKFSKIIERTQENSETLIRRDVFTELGDHAKVSDQRFSVIVTKICESQK